MRLPGFSRFAWTVLAATVVSLAVAGERVVSASPSEEAKRDCSAGSGTAAAPLAITLNATLTGTVMVDSGRSLALFEPAGGAGVMHEGEAFADGTLLCEVQADRIVVGQAGSRREIFLGSKGQPTVRAPQRYVRPVEPEVATSAPEVAVNIPVFVPENAQPAVASTERREAQPAGRRTALFERRATNFHAMLERRQAQPAVQ